MEQDESHLGVQTVKLYGESVGLSSVPEEAAKFLADEMSFILREIIQDASKFMRHSKRHISSNGSPNIHSRRTSWLS